MPIPLGSMSDESPASEPTPFEPPIDDTLAKALARHAIELPAEQVAMLDRYCRVLWDWNEKINLTRHTDYEKFVTRDLIDTQVLARHLEPDERVLDVGSGGGVPGLVLAIIRPDLTVTLSDSVGKKARVLEDIVLSLGLEISVHQGAAQELLATEYFDTLVVRAVAPLAKLLTWLKPHWGAFRRLLVIKGPAWSDERHEAREKGVLAGLDLRKRDTWPLPGTYNESVLLEIQPKAEN